MLNKREHHLPFKSLSHSKILNNVADIFCPHCYTDIHVTMDKRVQQNGAESEDCTILNPPPLIIEPFVLEQKLPPQTSQDHSGEPGRKML